MASFRPRATTRAQQFRNEATPAEWKLWRYLSASQLDGFKFNRQIPVGSYIADFVRRSHRLIVEIDSESHNARLDYDEKRTDELVAAGYEVIRFTNSDIFERIEGVLIKIGEALKERPTPNPSRKREGDLAA